jgi:uncharacterized protein YuzE
MKLNYYPETDSLYIELSAKASVNTLEVAEGLLIDLGKDGAIVGIDIDNASKKTDLDELTLSKIPANIFAKAA